MVEKLLTEDGVLASASTEEGQDSPDVCLDNSLFVMGRDAAQTRLRCAEANGQCLLTPIDSSFIKPKIVARPLIEALMGVVIEPTVPIDCEPKSLKRARRAV